MATPIMVQKDQIKFEVEMTRDGETKNRSLTFDTTNIQSALEDAQSFQKYLAGTGGFSTASIVGNQFVQPTGWRDNDPDEDPWVTTKVGLVSIHTDEIYYGDESAL